MNFAKQINKWITAFRWQRYRWIDRRFGTGHPVSSAQWDSEYQKGYWDKLTDIEEMGHYAIIAAYIQRFTSAPKILDIGCGEGVLLNYLSKDIYSEYLGIDLSQTAIDKATIKQDSKTRFQICDISTFTSKSNFDVIILNEVLYYLSNPVKVMSQLNDSMNASSIFIVSMVFPAGEYIWPKLESKFSLISSDIITNVRGSTWKIGVFHRNI